MSIAKKLLALGGSINISTALTHIVIVAIGIPAYHYFGVSQNIIKMFATQQLLLPMSIMILTILLFFVAGLYGLSGAKLLPRLPALKLVLFIIDIIYCLRDAILLLLFFPTATIKLAKILDLGRPIVFHDWVIIVIWLITGLCYLVGVITARNVSAKVARCCSVIVVWSNC